MSTDSAWRDVYRRQAYILRDIPHGRRVKDDCSPERIYTVNDNRE